MERRYTTGVIRLALKGTAGAITDKTALAHDWERGIFTATKFRGGSRSGILGATVHDVQSWLARRRELAAPEWLLRKVLDDAAAETLMNEENTAKRNQRRLDKETSFDVSAQSRGRNGAPQLEQPVR